MKGNKSERYIESVERDERRCWKIDWRMLKEDYVKDRLLIIIETHVMVTYL